MKIISPRSASLPSRASSPHMSNPLVSKWFYWFSVSYQRFQIGESLHLFIHTYSFCSICCYISVFPTCSLNCIRWYILVFPIYPLCSIWWWYLTFLHLLFVLYPLVYFSLAIFVLYLLAYFRFFTPTRCALSAGIFQYFIPTLCVLSVGIFQFFTPPLCALFVGIF